MMPTVKRVLRCSIRHSGDAGRSVSCARVDALGEMGTLAGPLLDGRSKAFPAVVCAGDTNFHVCEAAADGPLAPYRCGRTARTPAPRDAVRGAGRRAASPPAPLRQGSQKLAPVAKKGAHVATELCPLAPGPSRRRPLRICRTRPRPPVRASAAPRGRTRAGARRALRSRRGSLPRTGIHGD